VLSRQGTFCKEQLQPGHCDGEKRFVQRRSQFSFVVFLKTMLLTIDKNMKGAVFSYRSGRALRQFHRPIQEIPHDHQGKARI
jgi:hypothetical protein